MDKQSNDLESAPEQKPINTPDLPPETGDPEADHEARVEYWKNVNQPPAPKPKRTNRWVVIIIAIAVILLGAGVFAYWKFAMQKPDVVTVNQQQKKTDDNAKKTITAETKHYASSTLNLEFDYPADWTVVNETSTAPLAVRSPAMQLKDGAGKTVTGQIVMSIQAKQTSLKEFDKGAATAIRASEKVSYSKPTSAQRAQTYLSFLQYAGTSSGMDAVYITGDHGYTKDQDISQADIIGADPLVRVVFVKCNGTDCSGVTPAFAITASSWDSKAFADPIRNMLTSLAIN